MISKMLAVVRQASFDPVLVTEIPMPQRKATLFRPSMRSQTVIEHVWSLIRESYGFAQTVSGNGLPHVVEAEPLDRLSIGNWGLRKGIQPGDAIDA
jgi:hypothetical protein